MMKIEKVKAVLEICEQFKARAEEWIDCEENGRPYRDDDGKIKRSTYLKGEGARHSALHRTSMELTRALADMRRPN